ncbi:hypothetical protein ASG48_16000 [Aurantimonas sp. Leaf443]|nr:hypothetical protein ASG48_16000 [Aurantimonas sp. Leaf443]
MPQDGAEAEAAADGVDIAAPAEVEVTGEPDKVVETPANSTDLPDEAGLQAADEPQTADPFLVRLQILLDRAHASPGVIDGFSGGNTKKAIGAYEAMNDLPVDGEPDAELWAKLEADGAPAVKTYEITEADVKGPFVKELPSDYAELAKLKSLAYSGPLEMLAERFHMDEQLLTALNPQADFDKPGTTILVADTGAEPTTKVARIVVDKTRGELIAYDGEDRIVLVDPATIGSPDSPSPSGTVEVKGVAPEPTYSYDPSKNFKQGDNTEKLTLPAGPNGPVGSVWIDLSKPTYGIHGTPNPDMIDKGESHGCVRLTNWDAEALAELVEPSKTVVEFKG